MWKDRATAQSKTAEKARIEKRVKQYTDISQDLEEARLLVILSKEESDVSLEGEIATNLERIQKRVHALQIETLLCGEKDFNDAIVTIHPGAGGTESQDWAEMLTRMYLRWAERAEVHGAKGYQVTTLDLLPGDEAGIKSVTFSVSGPYAYGYLKGEMGVHRLVRISPFDANKRRHTSFASVSVSPKIDDDVSVVIDEKELRIDTYRSSGAGGQNVNKTSSAVRITHLPSGIVVQCQNERSQLQNRHVAMTILRSRLYDIEVRKKDEAMTELVGEKKEIGWGHQIRSYVFQPYQMVKDLRTGVEVGNVSAVMDGDIDCFIEGYLGRHKRAQ